MIDKVRGFADRSLWFRQAIAEKLKALGHPVSDDMIFPPSRTSAHRLAVVMDEEAKPVSEARKPVEYKRPKRTRKTS